ncbi:MAG: hypothetical protein NT114_00825 [Patescibacteria group bacterium]|nr:hypothetical protein [Patescibacteria group bacterium]
MHLLNNKIIRNQVIPISVSIVVCAILIVILYIELLTINSLSAENISLQLSWPAVLVGMTIYLKTSVDFAILIGRMMSKNKGLKARLSIEVGTALGNALGTMAVLLVWVFVKQVNWLLALMVFLASLVLLRLAQDSLEDIIRNGGDKAYDKIAKKLDRGLKFINQIFDPVLSKIIPSQALKIRTVTGFGALIALSFTVPFILGLDDFAGYVPLFNVVNVFGFAVGVFIGHMILNIFLFAAPSKTIAIVKNPAISLAGSIVFVGLAIWGLHEAYKLLLH